MGAGDPQFKLPLPCFGLWPHFKLKCWGEASHHTLPCPGPGVYNFLLLPTAVKLPSAHRTLLQALSSLISSPNNPMRHQDGHEAPEAETGGATCPSCTPGRHGAPPAFGATSPAQSRLPLTSWELRADSRLSFHH